MKRRDGENAETAMIEMLDRVRGGGTPDEVAARHADNEERRELFDRMVVAFAGDRKKKRIAASKAAEARPSSLCDLLPTDGSLKIK